MITPKKIKVIKAIVRRLFKNSKGEPYELTDGQAHIFYAFINPNIKEAWISATTRYGKTDVASMALIYLAVFKKLKIPIVAGSSEKARLIMEYIVQHIGDHEELYRGLINVEMMEGKAEAVEKLKVQMSKSALRWSDGGWIFITSVDSRNISREGEGVVGEGGDVVVLEEAGLIRQREQFSKIVRMTEGEWAKLVMIGNCVEGSVFEDAFNDPNYYKVRIDLDQAIKEGRINIDRLERQKAQTTTKDWKRYYLVEFPKPGEYTFFKPKRYEVLPPPTMLKYYGAIDPSLGETKKSSKIGIIVLGVDKDLQKYEIESIVEQLSPDEAVRKIFNMPYKFERFAFEAIQFQKYFMEITKKKSRELGLNIPFEGLQQAKKKEERIESMEPTINTGGILFKGDNQLWRDMQDYPETEFLDGLDALEMADRISTKKKPSVYVGGDMY